MVSNKIKSLRESLGWSQARLARSVGFTSSAISMVEKGLRLPSLTMCHRLATVFQVTMESLIDDEVHVNPEDEAREFFIKFGLINFLSGYDQDLIMEIALRLSARSS